MSMSGATYADRTFSEWHRLNAITDRIDRDLKVAWSRSIVLGKREPDLFREVILDGVVRTAMLTAPVYGLTFNPTSPVWNRLVDFLTDRFMKVVDNDSAKAAVKQILPSGLSLPDRNDRLNTFGLDERSAVRLEHMRQEGANAAAIREARISLSVQRGNLVSLTEANRFVNTAIETLCIDNMTISKADSDLANVWFYEDSVPKNITSISQLPKRARKEVITRRDGKVCPVCDPLDGISVRIGEMFDTELGVFQGPPFHPRCRCFLGVSL